MNLDGIGIESFLSLGVVCVLVLVIFSGALLVIIFLEGGRGVVARLA